MDIPLSSLSMAIGAALLLFLTIDVLTRYNWDGVTLSWQQRWCKVLLHVPFASFLSIVAFLGISLMVEVLLGPLYGELQTEFPVFVTWFFVPAQWLYAMVLGLSSSEKIVRALRESRHNT